VFRRTHDGPRSRLGRLPIIAVLVAVSLFGVTSLVHSVKVFAWSCDQYFQEDTQVWNNGVRLHQWLGYCMYQTWAQAQVENYQSGQDARYCDGCGYVNEYELYDHFRAWQCGNLYADSAADWYNTAYQDFWTGWGPYGLQYCGAQADSYYVAVNYDGSTWTNYLSY
jgi:hypothetical protein